MYRVSARVGPSVASSRFRSRAASEFLVPAHAGVLGGERLEGEGVDTGARDPGSPHRLLPPILVEPCGSGTTPSWATPASTPTRRSGFAPAGAFTFYGNAYGTEGATGITTRSDGAMWFIDHINDPVGHIIEPWARYTARKRASNREKTLYESNPRAANPTSKGPRGRFVPVRSNASGPLTVLGSSVTAAAMR